MTIMLSVKIGVKEIKNSFGSSHAVISDMSKGIEVAVKYIFGDVPHFICHFHFLDAVGQILFDKENTSLRNALSKAGISGNLKAMRRKLAKKFINISAHEIENSLKEPEKLLQKPVAPEICLYYLIVYYGKMRFRAEEPNWPNRDRLILSKGHGALALYAILARLGYFDLSHLENLRRLCGKLQGHPCKKTTPGVEISTGSLGQGLSVSNGIALAGKLDKKSYHVYFILGDGEIQEGQIWEAAMTASRFSIDNLCTLIDYNKLQIDGPRFSSNVN